MRQKVKITPSKLRKFYYRANISAADTARHFGCTPTTIKNYLKKYDWRIKTQSEVMRGRKLSPEHKVKVVKNLRNYSSG